MIRIVYNAYLVYLRSQTCFVVSVSFFFSFKDRERDYSAQCSRHAYLQIERIVLVSFSFSIYWWHRAFFIRIVQREGWEGERERVRERTECVCACMRVG